MADPAALEPVSPPRLRRGWTTGATAAAAAATAARIAISIAAGRPRTPTTAVVFLPRRTRWLAVHMPIVRTRIWHAPDAVIVRCWIRKDAGDDPDITHGALIAATVRIAPDFAKHPAGEIVLNAGRGVGMVTRPGLPIPVGAPAITPKPRAYIIENVARALGGHYPAVVSIAVAHGETLAEQTWNPRLGIVGGLSILGTTGVVIPYSCSAWIHAIYRGIDVARAENFPVVGAATGKTSDAFLSTHFDIPPSAVLDMGDFIGAMVKYLHQHPVPVLIICGGAAKMLKHAQGADDLHNHRSQIDGKALTAMVAPQDRARLCSTVEAKLDANERIVLSEIVQQLQAPEHLYARIVAQSAARLRAQLPATRISVVIIDRAGNCLARDEGDAL